MEIKIMLKIKKILYIIIIIIALIFCNIIATTYVREARVIKVSGDSIQAIDKTDEYWEFKGTNFAIDDKVKLVMNDNNTDNIIKDDIIKRVIKINN